MATETVTIESAAEVFKTAARIFAEVPQATTMRLMELSTQGEARRWRELVSWERESTEADVLSVFGSLPANGLSVEPVGSPGAAEAPRASVYF